MTATQFRCDTVIKRFRKHGATHETWAWIIYDHEMQATNLRDRVEPSTKIENDAVYPTNFTFGALPACGGEMTPVACPHVTCLDWTTPSDWPLHKCIGNVMRTTASAQSESCECFGRKKVTVESARRRGLFPPSCHRTGYHLLEALRPLVGREGKRESVSEDHIMVARWRASEPIEGALRRHATCKVHTLVYVTKSYRATGWP